MTDPDAASVLVALRANGVRTGLLSNTHWPPDWHERILERDRVAGLLDARVYTSELAHIKPHPDVFAEVLRRLAVDDPATAVFVGDRPYDDIFGAQRSGMRTVLRPNDGVPAYDVVPDATISALPELLPLIEKWA